MLERYVIHCTELLANIIRKTLYIIISIILQNCSHKRSVSPSKK
ncbi:unnamed protein product [Moneuplotes crassus]|uniref:Uncharacterized protein n=1 Tax=Euplotes crassus TaxID=5936 RepID=A0AAD1U4P4_EUPCR|nr:unnamed protein product [Moneuplotes crassus]